jgi:putative hydrolase of the HAD superfamily
MKMLTEIEPLEVVLFDWAGVLVYDAFKDMSKYEENFGIAKNALQEAKNKYWIPLSLAEITEEQFWPKVFTEAGILPADNFIEMVRKDLLESHQPYQQSWLLVNTIKKYSPKIKLGLLTNNCKEWFEYWEQKYSLSKTFDSIITSYNVHYRKPDRRIYDAAIRVLDVDPRKILFLDDQIPNVEAARSAGMQAVLFQPY